jgi:hypothetical protein
MLAIIKPLILNIEKMIENLALLIIKIATYTYFSDMLKNPSEKICIATNTNQIVEPPILTFESKVVNQPLQKVFKLPEGDDKKKIKIPLNGKFQLVFEKASSVSKKKEDDDDKKAIIIDNDATDGTATIQLPESIMEGFIKVQNEETNVSKLTVEDKLYYSKTDLTELKPNEKKEDKEKCYRLGSKIFPVPDEFS